MRWTQQLLARYFRHAAVEVRLEGISEEEFQRLFHNAAMTRLRYIEAAVHSEEMSDRQKLAEIARLLEE